MILMYVIAWGVVELSFEMAGGYNPEMKQFKSGNGDGFTVALVLFTVLLSVIMWMMCSTCADKYSTFSIQKKAAKLKAKNPYSDRGKEVKPLNSMIAMIFCTCGAQSMKEDGIDNEEAKKKTDALHLTPPPPPVDEKVYKENMKKLNEWKEHEKKEAEHDIKHQLVNSAINLEKNLEKAVIKIGDELEDGIEKMELQAELAANRAKLEMERVNNV
mgnify:FL=1